MLLYFGFFWIRSVQSWSDLIKLDQTWSNWISYQSKNVTIKICHIYKKDNNDCFILDFFRSDLFKLDQNGFSLIKKCYYKKLSHLQKGSKWLFYFWFFGSDLSKMDQTWSNFLARNGFLAIMAWLLFCSKILLSNLKWLFGQKCFFWLEMAFFKWICLIYQSIERFGSPLMTESFQACFCQFLLQRKMKSTLESNCFHPNNSILYCYQLALQFHFQHIRVLYYFQ